MTHSVTKVHRSDRLLPKVMFVDDLNSYRDILPGVSTIYLREIIANTYLKAWALPVTVNGRHTGKLANQTLDPDILPYPNVKYRDYVVSSADISTVERQLVITFSMELV